jgi:hypothetical protein
MHDHLCTEANLPQPWPQSILTQPIDGMGGDEGKLHKRAFIALNDVKAAAMQGRARALPADSITRTSFFGAGKDKIAHAIVDGHPVKGIEFTSLEYSTAIQNYFGVPLTH